MPRLTDLTAVRALLETDRPWAAYALGDLAPGFAEYSEWFSAPSERRALALLYRAFDTPVLFTLGDPLTLDKLLDEMRAEPKLYLSVRPEILPLIKAHWKMDASGETAMWRMIVAPQTFRPAPAQGVARLGSADLPALRRLYADGETTGEAPDFFSAEMVRQGTFFGVYEEAELIAAAGTHVIAPGEGVGAVGNVYTRRDRRGRGLAARVTSAVTAELLQMRLRTVVLNVNQHNEPAVQVYERLGYVRYCAFYEGLALKP